MSRIPQAYGYARVSDNKQASKEESINGQISRCEGYYRAMLEPKGIGWQGVKFDRMGVSASKTLFEQRPSGKVLMQSLCDGDHLIFDKPDRVWRSMVDFANLVDWFKKHNIFTHFVSLGFDTSTAMGECMLTCFVAFAKLEADQLSERVLARNEQARRNGRPTSPHAPMGTSHTWVGHGASRHLAVMWNPGERALMAQIVRLRNEKTPPRNWNKIADIIEMDLAAVNGRTFSKSAFYKRAWSGLKAKNAFAMEMYYRDNNIDSVTEIPQHPVPTAIAYCERVKLL